MQSGALIAAIAAALVLWTVADAPQPSGSAAASAAASPDGATASPSASMPAAIDIYADAIREMRTLEGRGNPPYLVYDLEIDSHNLHWYPNVDDDGYADWDVKVVHSNETADYRIWYRSDDQRALVQD